MAGTGRGIRLTQRRRRRNPSPTPPPDQSPQADQFGPEPSASGGRRDEGGGSDQTQILITLTRLEERLGQVVTKNWVLGWMVTILITGIAIGVGVALAIFQYFVEPE